MIPNTLAAAALLALALAAQTQPAAPADLLPKPDAAMQGAIRRALEAPSAEDQRRALEALRAQAGAQHERLVPQLFLLLQQATDTREAMAFGVLAEALPIPPEHVVRALVPLLESEDRALRGAVGNVLAEYEDRSSDRGASFTVYRPLLAANAPAGLVRHLFETDPGAALLTLARLESLDSGELRALLWAEHEVGDVLWKLRHGFLEPAGVARAAPRAGEELARLSRHPRWWARLYATEVARQQPALRAAVALEELQRDPHPLVRASAAAAAEQGR